MEQLLQFISPLFIAGIISLTEMLKAVFPTVSKRLLTIITAVALGLAFYFGQDLSYVEGIVNMILSLLTSSGLYGLFVKPAKDQLLNKN